MVNVKSIICAALLVGCGLAHAEFDLTVHSPRVVDGDTIDTGVKMFANVGTLRLRILGIDTPEMKGKCEKERALAREAKQFLVTTLKDQKVEIQVKGWDKYGGRILGVPFVNGVSVSQQLIDRGLAVPYSGGAKVKNWCQ